MKILLPIDGSPCSQAAVEEVCRRPWPPGSEVTVLSAVHVGVPEPLEPVVLASPPYEEALRAHRRRADECVRQAADQVRARHEGAVAVATEVLDGPPKRLILEKAERWGADLIVLGSHGYGPAKRFLLGSVSHAVALQAPCSVEIVRRGRSAAGID